MEVFNADRQRNTEINNLLQRIKYQAEKQEAGSFIYFPIFAIEGNKVKYKENLLTQDLFRKLKEMGAIEFSKRTNAEINEMIEENAKLKNKPFTVEGYWVKPIEPKFSRLCEEYKRGINENFEEKTTLLKPKDNKAAQFPIKDIRLDEHNYLLEINNGGKIISFKSKKKGEGLGKETKLFKILFHLWDFRWELKGGNILKKGNFISLDNLTVGSGGESSTATYKQIQRLNGRFKNEGVAIEIKGENGKYRLIINKA
jgi:hypothetical protein